MKHIIGFLILTLSCSAFAQRGGYSYMGSYVHEINPSMTMGSYTSHQNCKDCDTGTRLEAGASYLHYLKDGFQVGGEVGFASLSKEESGIGESATIFDLVGVGVYNFQADLKDSFYAKAGIGLYSVVNDDRDGFENKLGLMIAAGKRFALFPSVLYVPEVRFTKKGDLDMGLTIQFLNFGIYWN